MFPKREWRLRRVIRVIGTMPKPADHGLMAYLVESVFKYTSALQMQTELQSPESQAGHTVHLPA